MWCLQLISEVGKASCRLAEEALLHRWNLAIARIHFHALHPVHWKEHSIGRYVFTSLDLPGKILKRIQVNSTQADARRSDGDHRTPIFFSWMIESNEHHSARSEIFSDS